LALKRREPHLFQNSKGLHDRIPFGEDHEVVSREQVTAQLPSEFPKQSLRPISADCSPKSLPYHNSYPAAARVSPANHHIKQGSRNTTTVCFSILYIAAAFEKQIPVTSTLRHYLHPGRGHACTAHPFRGPISGLGHDHTSSSCCWELPSLGDVTEGEDSFVKPWPAWLDLYSQAGPPLRTATSQDLSAIFRAHPLTKSMLAFLLEVRWLLKCERHKMTPGLIDPRITGHYKDRLAACQTTRQPVQTDDDPGCDQPVKCDTVSCRGSRQSRISLSQP